MPGIGLGLYCMSKAAIDMLTKTLAMELARDGIRVNAVKPGAVSTKLAIRQGLSEEEYQKSLEEYKKQSPTGRIGTAEEVANVITFLASKESSFMNGSLVPIDGGWLNSLA